MSLQRWKVPLPKEQPDDGKVHFVFAFKEGGSRIELSGQAPKASAAKAFAELMIAISGNADSTSQEAPSKSDKQDGK